MLNGKTKSIKLLEYDKKIMETAYLSGKNNGISQ